MTNVEKEQFNIAETQPWRVLPSIIDGLISSQRKILHTLLQPKTQKEIKVNELANKVAILYTQDPDRLEIEQSIIQLAQNFVGANNINYLEPNGWFGSRRDGGKDAAEGRFIYTKLSNITRTILSEGGDMGLARRVRKGKLGEPRTYNPAIPMILVNGYEARGQDWQTYIPPYNPKDVIANLRRRVRGASKSDMQPMQPWFRNWTGQVKTLGQTHHSFRGTTCKISENVLEVTELPPRLWTQDFRSELDKHISEHSPPMFKSYTEHPINQGVRFEIHLDTCTTDIVTQGSLETTLQLHKNISTDSMIALDGLGNVQRYATELDILEDFYLSKLKSYTWNKTCQLLAIKRELTKLDDQSRFVKLLLQGDLDMSTDRSTLVTQLIKHNLTPVENLDDMFVATKKRKRDVHDKSTVSGYEHLFEMTVASMLPGPMRELDLLITNKKAEIAELDLRSIGDIWEGELQVIEEEWNRQLEYDRMHPQSSSCEKCGGLECRIAG
ncbi:type II DNA topoisomerase [Aureobasidium namibiae CBS 147.97]|uniref:DNA topoisomerase (ATP-hydrolyzing) n=1 Tax=Aureobasidium namibiae CBS 147.97 TaxID=1043004 RepID=A0A074WI58_9PEZI|nr:type II DNA topoisomerase [Aureobasidium namibiae CBS 147.97]KEQ72810.1 type II DNA topoisomerase [Aureobasidium namibiae CBS 147.97]